MREKRYEVTYYVQDDNASNGLRKGQYHSDEKDLAIMQAKILKNDLGYFPVVVYDNHIQKWVDF